MKSRWLNAACFSFLVFNSGIYMKSRLDWKFIILGCLTLGLAPFFPEPHIWGKLKWLAGGAVGMQPLDWFDALFHGLPWLLLLFNVGILIGKKVKSTSVKSSL
jgi:hypothetical protein